MTDRSRRRMTKLPHETTPDFSLHGDKDSKREGESNRKLPRDPRVRSISRAWRSNGSGEPAFQKVEQTPRPSEGCGSG